MQWTHCCVYFPATESLLPRCCSQESDFQLTVTDDLQDAAKKAVSIAQICTLADAAKLNVTITAAK